MALVAQVELEHLLDSGFVLDDKYGGGHGVLRVMEFRSCYDGLMKLS
jgi:hypothetical protein